MTNEKPCLFCTIISGSEKAPIVYDDNISVAFLDKRPLFPGHTLLVPKAHLETLTDIPSDKVGHLFQNAQLLAKAIEDALQAEGTFVAINNKVSQSVPHLHIHIVPRKKKDGLKGFFWPRKKYDNEAHIEAVRCAIQTTIAKYQK